jgi:hypothetical protein
MPNESCITHELTSTVFRAPIVLGCHAMDDRPTKRIRSAHWAMSTRPPPQEVPPTQRVSYLKKSAWRPSNPTRPSASVFVYNSSKTARKSLPSFLCVQLSYRMYYIYKLTAIASHRTTVASILSMRTTRYSFLVSVALARPRVIFLVYDSRSSRCPVWVC